MAASAAAAQQLPATPPVISTNGTAVVRVVPDLVDIQLGVEIRGGDLTRARQEQSERTVGVLAALRAAGVAETELQSSHVQIVPNYMSTDRSQADKLGFCTVSQTISCTLHEVKKLPDLIAAVVAAGATSVEHTNFRSWGRDCSGAMTGRAMPQGRFHQVVSGHNQR